MNSYYNIKLNFILKHSLQFNNILNMWMISMEITVREKMQTKTDFIIISLFLCEFSNYSRLRLLDQRFSSNKIIVSFA